MPQLFQGFDLRASHKLMAFYDANSQNSENAGL